MISLEREDLHLLLLLFERKVRGTARDQALAKDFLAKYTQGGERGLVPKEEQINQQTIAAFQSKQPGQGIGDGNVTAASRMGPYAGASGTQTS